jgi:HAE1 family hydrophobic/amphiphilic exporter-1
MGLNIPTIGNAIQLAFRGNDQSKFKDNGEEYAINIMYDKGDRKDISNLENTTIQTPTGATIRLGDVATVSEIQGQAVLERYNRLNSKQVLASSAGRPTGTVTADIKKQIDAAGFPSSVSIDYLGEQKNQGDSFGSLGIAMGLGFLLVYLIMVALYESTLYPLVVLFAIPVAIIGAMLALALTQESLSIFGIIGFIMLMGLVAKKRYSTRRLYQSLKSSRIRTERSFNRSRQRTIKTNLNDYRCHDFWYVANCLIQRTRF